MLETVWTGRRKVREFASWEWRSDGCRLSERSESTLPVGQFRVSQNIISHAMNCLHDGHPLCCHVNSCRTAGVSALAESLQKNRTLQNLALDNNQISQWPDHVSIVERSMRSWPHWGWVWQHWQRPCTRTGSCSSCWSCTLEIWWTLLLSKTGNPRPRDRSQHHPSFDINSCAKPPWCMTVIRSWTCSFKHIPAGSYIYIYT